MPKCKACIHPNRDAIDVCLLQGDSVRNVAAQFGLSSTCVQNHKTHHIHPKVAEVIAQKEERLAVKTAEQLDATLTHLLDTALDIMSDAKNHKDGRLAVMAMAEARQTILAARKIADGVTVNVQINNIELSDEEAIERAKRLVAGT